MTISMTALTRGACVLAAACLLLAGWSGVRQEIGPSPQPLSAEYGAGGQSGAPNTRHVAYFPNFFERHAVRLAVQPTEVTKSVQSRQVFIATIVDEEGKPRRNRRVEWI